MPPTVCELSACHVQGGHSPCGPSQCRGLAGETSCLCPSQALLLLPHAHHNFSLEINQLLTSTWDPRWGPRASQHQRDDLVAH